MFKLIFLAATLVQLSSAFVGEWQQCGGDNYNGDRACGSGMGCVYINQWYYQCQKMNQAPAQTASNPTQPTAATNTASQTAPGTCNKNFPLGKFRKGILFNEMFNVDLNNYDYVSIWMGTIEESKKTTDWNDWYQGDMLRKCLQHNKIPLFYAYIIAFEARLQTGMHDCDVNPNYNLCTHGSDYIRKNRDHLVRRYSYHAENIARVYGKEKPVIFTMEPDFWQYYGDNKQTGGKLSGEFMRALFDDFAKAIKNHLPNAIISWDISAWIGEDGMRQWWGYFKTSPYIDFVNTSGGQARGDLDQFKPNELRWSFVSQLTGKKIIADCGYGVNGQPDGSCSRWADKNNQQNRIRDGVVAVTIAKESGWVDRPNVDC